MSVDYPNREIWLAKRATKRRQGRYIHVSKELVLVPLPTPHFAVSKKAGVTYRRHP